MAGNGDNEHVPNQISPVAGRQNAGASRTPPRVIVVSDASGATAERVVMAALLQFEPEEVKVEKRANVRTPEDVQGAVNDAGPGGIIVHTLVSPELRQVLFTEARRQHVTSIDIMGPLLDRLTQLLGVPALAKPGLSRQLDAEYFKRIEAIEFTVNHDDGRNPQDLARAEIVLVGISRTSKTPLSIYLSYRGWQVANVPIMPGIKPPEELFTVDRKKVVGLTIHIDRLREVRMARISRYGSAMSAEYASAEKLEEELAYSGRIFAQGGWATVDVTRKSIEETAAEVIRLAVGSF